MIEKLTYFLPTLQSLPECLKTEWRKFLHHKRGSYTLDLVTSHRDSTVKKLQLEHKHLSNKQSVLTKLTIFNQPRPIIYTPRTSSPPPSSSLYARLRKTDSSVAHTVPLTQTAPNTFTATVYLEGSEWEYLPQTADGVPFERVPLWMSLPIQQPNDPTLASIDQQLDPRDIDRLSKKEFEALARFKRHVEGELTAVIIQIDTVVHNMHLPSISTNNSSKTDLCSILCDLLAFLLYLHKLFTELPTRVNIPPAFTCTNVLPSPSSDTWPYTEQSTDSLKLSKQNYSEVYEYENSITDCQSNHIMEHFSSLSERLNESIQAAYQTSFTHLPAQSHQDIQSKWIATVSDAHKLSSTPATLSTDAFTSLVDKAERICTVGKEFLVTLGVNECDTDSTNQTVKKLSESIKHLE